VKTPVLRTGHAEKNRVEAFSDGVLAIVVTLLILDVQIPHGISGSNAALWQALRQQLPMIGAWILSFFFVLVFWVTHHYFFKQLEAVDRGVLWLNGIFLLTISFTPFPTALLGLYPNLSASSTLLACAMFVTASSFTVLRWYATRHAKLFAADQSALAVRALRRSFLGPFGYFLAIVAAPFSIGASVALMIGVPLLFFIPMRQPADEQPDATKE
jgi:uncharacterized membrane protein